MGAAGVVICAISETKVTSAPTEDGVPPTVTTVTVNKWCHIDSSDRLPIGFESQLLQRCDGGALSPGAEIGENVLVRT